MFKYVILAAAVISVVSALPTLTPKPKPKNPNNVSEMPAIRLVKEYNESKDGAFSYGYETSNQVKVHQTSYLKNPGTDKEVRVVRGSYSYPLGDGRIVTVTYISDENGYRPKITYSR